MGLFDEKIWRTLEEKARLEDEQLPYDCKVANAYLEGVKKLCTYGIDRAKTIRDTFPLYTLHDETHIVNVVRLMTNLLGDHIIKLTRDEVAMLILSACCHDIGMSYSEEERKHILNDNNRILRYLDRNQGEYVKAFSSGCETPNLTESMTQNYLRCIHHERAEELLRKIEWPDVLYGKLICKDLIAVCQSHGNDVSSLANLKSTTTIDLRLCAILLRLADILDFDTKRAPQAIYEYSGFTNKQDAASKYSESEWIKHLSSTGFDFQHIPDRSYPYELEYYATSRSMQIEQAIHTYLDWVDSELSGCRQQLDCYAGKHRDLVLPRKIKRHIEPEGYMSGEYRLTLDQGQVMELLVGRNLYQDPAVFVRELLQNAIDAVRTREKLDRNLPSDWRPQINISSWMDSEGYHWFRIEDNGIGMTENIIRDFFLKIGRSYYNSDEFLKAKLRCKADPNYTPISRFGIGILSCFMGDEQTNLVEISTKHFEENGEMCPSLRMRMSGLSGYYYLASSEDYHTPGEMRGRSESERRPYRSQPGTAIAVRTNLYQTGKYRGFKEIVDRYVVYPPIPVHYDGDEGSFDYPTENEFINAIHNVQPSDDLNNLGLLEFSLTDDQIKEIQNDIPTIKFDERPTLRLKCVSLDSYTESTNLSGAILLARACGQAPEIDLNIAGEKVKTAVKISVFKAHKSDTLGITVELEFPEYFEKQMRVAESKQEKLERERYNRDFLEKYKSSYLLEEIAVAILRGHVKDPQWKKWMLDRMNITSTTLNSYIKQIQMEINDSLGILPSDGEMFNRFRVFSQMRKVWRFDLCNLNEFEWYTKFFLLLRNSTGSRSVVAHNGIYCGNADFFYDEWNEREKLGTIVLLKDKYRPTVDMSRDKIRQIPLEVTCDLEILRKQLESQGFEFEGSQKNLDEAHYPYISTREYVNLLKHRPDFIDRLRFSTNRGALSAVTIDEMVQKGETIKFLGCPKLNNHGYSSRNLYLYDYLCAAYLRSRYILRVDFSQYDPTIFIESRANDMQEKVTDYFSPTFFLSTKKEITYLTTKSTSWRKTCNDSHRLARFIIDNAEQLRSKVPGLFFEILRSLAEDDAKDVISVINDLLQRLRSLPDIGIVIPTDLQLCKDDFSDY